VAIRKQKRKRWITGTTREGTANLFIVNTFGRIFDTIKGPLLGVASALIPGGPLVLAAINEILPENKQLPDTVTGSDMRRAVSRLDPVQRASLMEKQLDVEIAELNTWATIQEAHSKADSTGSTTRPTIAMMMAWVVVLEVVIIVVAWAYAVFTGDNAMIKEVNEAWPMLLAIVATPTALLRAYFGMRTKEKAARYSASTGQPLGMVANLIKEFKKN
jgi:hypothetical protein